MGRAATVMADFTPTQGRYLAFIHAYTSLHGYPPAESEIAAAMCVSPPSVNQMIKMLERKGLIQRQPGEARSVRVLVPEDEIPAWNKRKPAPTDSGHRPAVIPAAPPANLYVHSVFLTSGPVSEKFSHKVIYRVIESAATRHSSNSTMPSFKRLTVGSNICTSFNSANVRSIRT